MLRDWLVIISKTNLLETEFSKKNLMNTSPHAKRGVPMTSDLRFKKERHFCSPHFLVKCIGLTARVN